MAVTQLTEDSSLLPTEEDVTFFEDNGYWIGPTVFTDERMAEARDRSAAIFAGEFATGRPPMLLYPTADPQRGLRKADEAWWADPVIEAIVTDPRIGRIAATLLGCGEVYLWHDQLLWKPGGSEGAGDVGWHQDKSYWTAVRGSRMLTAWIAFDDVTDDMGAMHFVPGSNRWGLVSGMEFFGGAEDSRAGITPPAGEEWSEVPAVLSAGQVSFHHCGTLHGSAANRTDRPRRSIAVHMMSGDSRLRRGQAHGNEVLLDAEDGELWRGPWFPRLWPPRGDAEIADVRDAPPGLVPADMAFDGLPTSLFGMYWLWKVGRDDDRPLDEHPGHAVRVLRDMARVAPDRHPGFRAAVRELVDALPPSAWTDHRWSPADVLSD